MVAPSKSFTVIADGAVDADSPLSVTLMTQLRDNDIHLEEWLGDGFTAAKDHNHDGVNSKLVASYGRMLEEKIVSGGAITSFDFATVLDGNTERLYHLLARVENAIGSTRVLSLRLNAGTLGSLVTIPTNGQAQVRIVLHVKNDVVAMIRSDEVTNVGAFTNTLLTRAVSAANVTSLGFSTPDAAIDNGSEFTLYRAETP